ncbi:DUF2059 domain-containing protein (plasmid) [Acaryochloris sp. 'Moss Beach']|uniref:DUF2059 domain-containing protein n=1 Tax=Acaryochloris TaxID=155977 RepID=UPI001BAEC605|nr:MULTISPECIES: DUF2059 domain-containing protein [Acaryochloris]QUY40386.1 DUF2059 domain-containing protein [Acaryochloris marina S15]UJB72808.1 DUF2059 domain-containing protein [Acaryochloris sp. 'Moss Beach']
MFKVKSYVSRLLLIFSLFITACETNLQRETSKQVRLEPLATGDSKTKLVRDVVLEIGIAQQYDLHLNNTTDALIPSSSSNKKWRIWLQEIVEKEAGWRNIEDQYIAHLEANFSEAELNKLLNLAKQPVMKKWLQANMKAYSNVAPTRQKLLEKVWFDYNSGKITPPDGVKPGS